MFDHQIKALANRLGLQMGPTPQRTRYDGVSIYLYQETDPKCYYLIAIVTFPTGHWTDSEANMFYWVETGAPGDIRPVAHAWGRSLAEAIIFGLEALIKVYPSIKASVALEKAKEELAREQAALGRH